MDLPSDSDESDVDFVPNEKDESDEESETEVIREDEEVDREGSKAKGKKRFKSSKKITPKRLKEDAPNGQSENEKTKTNLNDSVDKKHEDDLWKSFLSAPVESTPPKEDKPTKLMKVDEVLKPAKKAISQGAGGLSSVLDRIGKNNKISTLEKSKLDWNSFKKDEGIEEELSTHNRGRDGYLERQDFLQRTDLRQFEIEKSFRSGRRGKR